jgi:hypothetical protein
MSVVSTEWVRLLQSEYLADFIASGGSAVKIAVVLPQHAEDVINAVAIAAQGYDYQTVCVDAAQTRVHMIDQLFYAVARQIEWDALTDRWLRDLLSRNGIQVADGMPLQDTEALAAFNGLLVPDLFGQINRLITNALLKDYTLCKEFRTAMTMLCRAYLNPQDVAADDGAVIKQWLHGEKCNLTALKRLQIYQKIGRHNARLLLSSLAAWVHKAGHSGLVLLADLNAVVTELPPGLNPVRYTRSSLLDTYELLREFIDDTDETSHLLLVVIAGRGLLDDPKRSVDHYQALKLRISNDVHDRERANPLNIMVRFDLAGAESLSLFEGGIL